MYGPPQDCKGKGLGEETSLRQCIRPLSGDHLSLAMMSSAACLSLQVGRSLETIIGIRLKARRCDCSFVLAVPVQTSVGTYSTLLAECGSDVKVVQELMRHAKLSTTMEIYTHPRMERKREAQSMVVDALFARERAEAAA
jgi:hypothetical protein